MLKSMGQRLPEPWRNVPTIESLNIWYMDAFSDLSTCRNFGYVNGPIPWTAVVQYIDREEIKEDDQFIYVIKAMDAEYLEYIKEQGEKK